VSEPNWQLKQGGPPPVLELKEQIMNVGRFLASAAAVWLVRVALNWTFYTRVIGQQSQQIAAAHPGVFREVVPGLI
jgi:hypothetical protein